MQKVVILLCGDGGVSSEGRRAGLSQLIDLKVYIYVLSSETRSGLMQSLRLEE